MCIDNVYLTAEEVSSAVDKLSENYKTSQPNLEALVKLSEKKGEQLAFIFISKTAYGAYGPDEAFKRAFAMGIQVGLEVADESYRINPNPVEPEPADVKSNVIKFPEPIAA